MMNFATADPKPSEPIRRALELTGSSDLLPFFADRPKAMEAATRSAIGSLYALHFHSEPLLGPLKDPAEVNTVLGWCVQALESNQSGGLSFSASDEDSQRRLQAWSEAFILIEPFRTKRDFSVAFSSALRSYVLATAASTNMGGQVINSAPDGEMLDVSRAAERLGVTRPTIYDWLEKGRLIGWQRGTKQGWVIPAEQIAGSGRVAEGIEAVIAEIGDAELAWDFLSNPWPFSGGGARPMAKLLEGGGAVQQVVDAAPGYLVNMG